MLFCPLFYLNILQILFWNNLEWAIIPLQTHLAKNWSENYALCWKEQPTNHDLLFLFDFAETCLFHIQQVGLQVIKTNVFQNLLTFQLPLCTRVWAYTDANEWVSRFDIFFNFEEWNKTKLDFRAELHLDPDNSVLTFCDISTSCERLN